MLAAAVVAYALSPFDLIPDFIPVIGYLDDLIIVPIGITAVLRLMPADVLADCREQARTHMERRVSWVGAALCSRRVDRPHRRRSASPGRRSPVRQC
jgi:uncharacterized membrane protein YkvA (DUF1232 family)